MVFLFGAKQPIDRTALWTGIIAIVAAVGAGFAWRQLRSISKTASADFAKRFSDSFFTEQTRTVFSLLLNSAVEFERRKVIAGGKEIDILPCFLIKQDVATQLIGIVEFDRNKVGYSAFEIDDFLLGSLDDLGWYVEQKLIDLEMAFQMFGYYVINILDNEAIKKYLNDSKETYQHLQCIYGKFKAKSGWS